MVALEARARVFGLPRNLVGHEKAATALGRLWLTGAISESMREAGERYLEIHLAAMRALRAPTGPAATALALVAGGWAGRDGNEAESEDHVVWATKRVALYRALKTLLRDGARGRRSGEVETVVDRVVVEDMQPPENWLPALRAGLALLARRLGV